MVKMGLAALHVVATVVLRTPGGVLCIPQQRQSSLPARPWAFIDQYPRQYITHRLQPGEHVEIDGKLDEPAWADVNWTEPMEDIAQSFYEGLSIPESYATLMKVRFDAEFLYIGAKCVWPVCARAVLVRVLVCVRQCVCGSARVRQCACAAVRARAVSRVCVFEGAVSDMRVSVCGAHGVQILPKLHVGQHHWAQ